MGQGRMTDAGDTLASLLSFFAAFHWGRPECPLLPHDSRALTPAACPVPVCVHGRTMGGTSCSGVLQPLLPIWQAPVLHAITLCSHLISWWRWNSHTIKFTLSKCNIPWVWAHLQGCAPTIPMEEVWLELGAGREVARKGPHSPTPLLQLRQRRWLLPLLLLSGAGL